MQTDCVCCNQQSSFEVNKSNITISKSQSGQRIAVRRLHSYIVITSPAGRIQSRSGSTTRQCRVAAACEER